METTEEAEITEAITTATTAATTGGIIKEAINKHVLLLPL